MNRLNPLPKRKHWLAGLLMLAALSFSEYAVADYAQWCAECHGSLQNSTRKDSTAEQIRTAIHAIFDMKSLIYLTAADIDGVAVELGSPTTCRNPLKWVEGGSICGRPTPNCPASKIALNGFCIKPLPTCTPPQVLQNGVCAPEPVCDPMQEVQGGVCTEVDTADTCHVYTDHIGNTGLPSRTTIILSAPTVPFAKASVALSYSVTAFDCIGQLVSLKASKLPSGAKIAYRFDPVLLRQAATLTWTPSSKYANKVVKIIFTAKTKNKESTVKQTVPITVLP